MADQKKIEIGEGDLRWLSLLTGTLTPTMINFYQPVPQIASKSRMCTGHVGEPS
jgi:hypothetical protein